MIQPWTGSRTVADRSAPDSIRVPVPSSDPAPSPSELEFPSSPPRVLGSSPQLGYSSPTQRLSHKLPIRTSPPQIRELQIKGTSYRPVLDRASIGRRKRLRSATLETDSDWIAFEQERVRRRGPHEQGKDQEDEAIRSTQQEPQPTLFRTGLQTVWQGFRQMLG